MKEYDLFDALSDIDDRYILEAHQRPLSKLVSLRSKVRRTAAAALAACVALMLPVVADGWQLSTEGLLLFYGFSDQQNYSMSGRDGLMQVINNSICLDGSEIPYSAACDLDTVYLKVQVVSKNRGVKIHHEIEGASGRIAVVKSFPMKLLLEAMVLMEDGRVLYRQTEAEGLEELNLTMDNIVDGEEGIIINVRLTILFQATGGWVEAEQRSWYLPGRMGFSVPAGTDARFPDMQYNYDGRGEAAGR